MNNMINRYAYVTKTSDHIDLKEGKGIIFVSTIACLWSREVSHFNPEKMLLHGYFGPTACVPPDSYVETVTLNVKVLGDGVFGR